jgi:muramoyltetrapeptide carboxypeptidase
VPTHAGRHGYLAASDAERADDLNRAVRDPEIDAVWCLRGGYGTMRILEAVDWDAWSRRALPLIGFSDNTALHLALQRRGVVSLHGPHAATTDLPAFAGELLLRLLTRADPAGPLRFPPDGPARAATVHGGRAEGPLVGGNLALLCATLGTPYAVRAEGAILFMEEVGESAYRVDRMLTQLRLAGVLGAAAGIAVGAFTEVPGEGTPGTPPMAGVIAERLGDLGVPVAAGFPFGHVAGSWTLPLGVRAGLDADAGSLALLEPALRPPSPATP